ncbi:MAG: 5-formyltetrahydrofolate cyclo-ligase [Firmicutes bacterium HGW-Firmicutes-19]|jgi:5-formyltetrahydrofolate cyclo-ligase|nr:MAG: 5-formyltetrahydrofolate cyclo-ligase [Firmicutes bacterium HGW-Firmicutes-19]
MKADIRKEMILKRQELPLSLRLLKEEQVKEHVLMAIGDAKRIGIYCSARGEVDTYGLMEHWFWDEDISIYAPKVDGDEMDFYRIRSFKDLEKGRFDILEPKTKDIIDPKILDVIIIPIVAFDQFKHRIGYGKGYFDRYLKKTSARKIGIAFSFQEVDEILVDPFDVDCDIVITEITFIG